MRGFLLATAMTIALMGTASAGDPDLLRHPAPELHPQTTGCVTIHGKATISQAPYVSRICVGDSARAQDIACPSVADLYHTDKRLEDTLEDMKRRERKFGCKDIDGLRLRLIEADAGGRARWRHHAAAHRHHADAVSGRERAVAAQEAGEEISHRRLTRHWSAA